MRPDVEVAAAAKARRVKFVRVPDTDVRFAAHEVDEAESRSVRENLPERVEPGVEYEDIRIGWRAQVEIEGRTRRES